MQPLNTTVSPSSRSTIGWAPRSDRSMIFRRRWPSATGPRAKTPSASGPREAMAPGHPGHRCDVGRPSVEPDLTADAAHLAFRPYGATDALAAGQDPGVLAAAARGRVHDAGSARRHPGQRRRHDVCRHRIVGPAPQVYERPQVDVLRVHPLAVEGRVGGQCDRLLGDVALRLRLQLAAAGLQFVGGGFRPDHHARCRRTRQSA